MKTDAGLIQHSSRNQWRSLNKEKGAAKAASAKELAKEGEEATKPELHSGKKTEAASSDTESTLKKIASVPTPSLPSLPSASLPEPTKPLSIPAAKKIAEKKEDHSPAIIRKPAVFFVSGFQMGGLKGASFLEEMSKYIPDGKHFNWDEEEKMMSEIKKRPIDQPVVLVGYGLGGGTALSIANKLNNIKSGFRSVDLLVTIDASASPSDIIPQNVDKHVNFIGDGGGLFHDGPHIARNTEMTEVINELRNEKDVSLEENTEMQYKIFEGINQVLCESVIKKDLMRVLSSSELEPRAILLT